MDEIADWIRSTWWVVPTAGIRSSQNPDSLLSAMSIARSTNFQADIRSRSVSPSIRPSARLRIGTLLCLWHSCLGKSGSDGRVSFCASSRLPTRQFDRGSLDCLLCCDFSLILPPKRDFALDQYRERSKPLPSKHKQNPVRGGNSLWEARKLASATALSSRTPKP